jgi:hypothetical protein
MFTVLFSGAVFLSSLSSHRAGGAVNFSSLAPASLTAADPCQDEAEANSANDLPLRYFLDCDGI